MQKRNPWAVFGLSIITLGLYHPYWLMKVDEHLNELGYKNYPGWVLFPAYIFVSAAQLEETAGIFSLLSLFSLGYIIVWLYKFGESIEKATKGFIGKATAFLAPLLINSIGDALIQDKINKYIDGDTSVGIAPISGASQQQNQNNQGPQQ